MQQNNLRWPADKSVLYPSQADLPPSFEGIKGLSGLGGSRGNDLADCRRRITALVRIVFLLFIIHVLGCAPTTVADGGNGTLTVSKLEKQNKNKILVKNDRGTLSACLACRITCDDNPMCSSMPGNSSSRPPTREGWNHWWALNSGR